MTEIEKIEKEIAELEADNVYITSKLDSPSCNGFLRIGLKEAKWDNERDIRRLNICREQLLESKQ